MPEHSIVFRFLARFCLFATVLATVSGAAAASEAACHRTVHASVAALDQPYMYNRLGATNPGGMIFALLRDVVSTSGQTDPTQFQPGQVRLRADKRPRPLVLRMNVGDCLEIDFYNLLNPAQQAKNSPTRYASLHALGVELVNSIESDGGWVGQNPNGTACPDQQATTDCPVAPGNKKTYTWYAREEGNFLIYSGADPTGSQTGYGMFGSVNIQPTGAEWYRSQVTREDLIAAAYQVPDTPQPESVGGTGPAAKAVVGGAGTLQFVPQPSALEAAPGAGGPMRGHLINRTGKRKTVQMAEVELVDGRLFSPDGHPIVNYQAIFPDGTPVLSMVQTIAGAQVFSQSTTADELDRMLKLLDQGIVNSQLRGFFASQQIQLSLTPSVTRDGSFQFVILDAGQGYLTRLAPGPAPSVTAFEASFEQIYSDLTAIITGPNADRFPYSHNSPSFRTNPATPDRRQPYREFTIIYHQATGQVQAFNFGSANSDLQKTLSAGDDQFGINYGIAGIGAEILANRLGVGPMGNPDAVDLKYEEFFLSAWSVGDPALVVDVPANFFLGADTTTGPDCSTVSLPPGQPYPQYVPNCKTGEPPGTTSPQTQSPGPKATKAYFPDDPSNVYHSYMRDHVKFRISHAGKGPSHVHHLHAHQWLHSPNNDNGHYLDSQLIIPGSSYTLEITYNGSGNRNQTVGDSIFHCHFYPHFAQGMWSLWRVHDVFEAGTQLDAQGIPVAGWNRALPDGEITAGTPIPAIVPLPSLAMATMPAPVRLTTAADGLAGRRAVVQPTGTSPDGTPEYDNPGYPFFIPGVAGHRAPHPPMDFAWKEDALGRPELLNGEKQFLDGGLPRHLILNGTIVREFHTRWDFTKDFALYSTDDKKLQGPDTFVAGNLTAFRLPEEGTAVEKAAMQAHATRTHPSVLPNGDPGNFILNGLPPVPGAPYAAPDVDDDGDSMLDIRRYKAAVIQMDVVLNKSGWHYPQQRFITLWGDVGDTTSGKRAPEPFFFRSNTGDSIEFWHTDLVPYYYELDDFQVRTPTDIIGQHIHLVKFDVTSSDGAANGFNYEDGTLSPDEVRDRILAINNSGGLFGFDNKTQFQNPAVQEKLAIKPYKAWYPPSFGEAPANQNWDGAQTTIQRWDTDPLLNNLGVDRTLRTVFTHDHFGPSTHQQVGLYAGMLVEPEDAQWFLPNGQRMNVRDDGGPTSWEAVIVTQDPADSYREFMLEFQDTQLAYSAGSVSNPFDFANPANLNIPTTPLFNTDGSQTDGSGTSITTGLGNGQVTQPLRTAFAQNGITLTAQATAGPVSGNTCVKFSAGTPTWIVTDPKNPDEEEQYCIGTTNPPNTAAGTGTPIYIFLPDIYPGWSDPAHALATAGGGSTGKPYPQLISFTGGSIGTYSLNYRSEPLPYRVQNPQSGGASGDLADAFRSNITRLNPAMNTQPTPGTPIDPSQPNGFKYPPFLQPTLTGGGTGCALDSSNVGKVQPCDPYTPLLRAYANDKIQVRTLVGAHLQPHSFQIQGVEWNFEPSSTNSGFRNVQEMGLSEHFEMLFNLPPASARGASDPPFADYLYAPSSGTVGLTNGAWGILRGYEEQIGQPGDDDYLMPLPENTPGSGGAIDYQALYEQADAANQRSFDITATSAALAYCSSSPCTTPDGAIPYNQRASLTDTDGLIYVNTSDLNANGQINAGVPKEPLILRANAGDWVKVTLRNAFTSSTKFLEFDESVLPSPFGSGGVPKVNLNSSQRVGLHPQLLAFDAKRGNGINVGFNTVDVTVAPGQPAKEFYWYAGDVFLEPGCQPTDDDDCVRQVPVEYGATALVPTDMLGQHFQGLYGALIIEPEGSTWEFQPDPHDASVTTRASAIVTPGDGSPAFYDFVLIIQNDVENYDSVTGGCSSFFGSINYRFEPFGCRNVAGTAPLGYAQALSNSTLSPAQDPETPIFELEKGAPFRFRLLFPGGPANNGVTSPPVFTLDGHVWQEEPYTHHSTVIGDNPFSQWMGGQNFLPYTVFNWVFPSAGGTFQIPGDYLYSGYQQLQNNGLWGILRVTDTEYEGGSH